MEIERLLKQILTIEMLKSHYANVARFYEKVAKILRGKEVECINEILKIEKEIYKDR